MDIFTSCSIAFLEMTFVFVGLLLLHGLRKVIGNVSFYIALGLLLVFTQLVTATGLKVVVGFPGADFYIAPTVLFLPYLGALMVVYITEGTLSAQRLIIGAMATLGLYVYLSHLTALQCNWEGMSIAQGTSADSLNYLLSQSRKTMVASILAQTLDLFLIPIFFQRLRNLNCRMFIAVLGALMLTLVVDTFVYETAVFWLVSDWHVETAPSYITKAAATIWISILATIYLTRIVKEIPGEGRGTLDIVLAFFGGYGKTKELQQNIAEWEGRYGVVVKNASDMILVLNEQGTILDANNAALRIFHLDSKNKLLGKSFQSIMFDIDEEEISWKKYIKALSETETEREANIQRLQCFADTKEGVVELDVALSIVEVDKVPMLIAFGRDVTEQNRLAREKEDLREQLAHTQRLESVGKLAGGVAHDFNNYIHAILGHLDVIKYMHDLEDEKIIRHLEKITDISENAGKLTQQLLGFARKGKYLEKKIDLKDLVKETASLFRPNITEGMDFELKLPKEPGKMTVKGDPVQLQQVLLNILINAQDALEENDNGRYLELALQDAGDFVGRWNPPSEMPAEKKDFFCISIIDNGIGIDKLTMNRIFEPFFTTKAIGKGTGMGLAMAYGTISNHRGWIQVESEVGEGTEFDIFLPHSISDPASLHKEPLLKPEEPHL